MNMKFMLMNRAISFDCFDTRYGFMFIVVCTYILNALHYNVSIPSGSIKHALAAHFVYSIDIRFRSNYIICT